MIKKRGKKLDYLSTQNINFLAIQNHHEALALFHFKNVCNPEFPVLLPIHLIFLK